MGLFGGKKKVSSPWGEAEITDVKAPAGAKVYGWTTNCGKATGWGWTTCKNCAKPCKEGAGGYVVYFDKKILAVKA
jgi:hypothetical protein